MTVIDEYFEKVNREQRAQLERIRSIAMAVVPEAQEVIAYGMPTLQFKKKSFLGFTVHANHIGIYPYGGEEIKIFAEELKKLGYGYSSGAIRVPFGQEFPEVLLKKIIAHRIRRIGGRD